MTTHKPIRVLIAKPGLDGHDRGGKVVARGLVDAGMEVIYTGIRNTPAQIAQTALEEDVNIVGLSILSGAHMKLSERVLQELGKRKIDDRPVILGGVVPFNDIERLKKIGISEIFRPGTPIKEIVAFIKNTVNKH
jgi:methylmalonyl-CoA mutase C-terminal domain/subunit